jgi:hypothetical protein
MLQLISLPFPVRGYKRIAVKVVDVYATIPPSSGIWTRFDEDPA